MIAREIQDLEGARLSAQSGLSANLERQAAVERNKLAIQQQQIELALELVPTIFRTL